MNRLRQALDSYSPLPLMYLMMLPTLAYGIGFGLLPHSATVEESVLHITMRKLSDETIPLVWGFVLIGVLIITSIATAGKNVFLGGLSAMVGFMAWVFATIMYVQAGQYLLMTAVTIPSMLFWVWYYERIRVTEYKGSQ